MARSSYSQSDSYSELVSSLDEDTLEGVNIGFKQGRGISREKALETNLEAVVSEENQASQKLDGEEGFQEGIASAKEIVKNSKNTKRWWQ